MPFERKSEPLVRAMLRDAIRRMASGWRKNLICAALIGTTFLTVPPPARADDPIKIGSIFDLTGDLNIYGIQQSRGLHLAVDKINEDGGLLGRKVEIVESDAQSQQAKYTQYANTLLMRDHISALFAGLTSSAREAIRPSLGGPTSPTSIRRFTRAGPATSRPSLPARQPRSNWEC